MSSVLVDETGYFWWNGVAVPVGRVAPDSAVGGRLTIDNEGRSRLELDGVLPSNRGPMAAFSNDGPLPEEQHIHGILKSSNKSVRLSQLNRNGGRFTTNGISFERYAARRCLIGNGPFRDREAPLMFQRLTVDLKGFEQWLWLQGINVDRTESGATAEYRRPDKICYALDDGEMQIVYGIIGPYRGKSHCSSLNLTEYAELIQIPREAMSLQDLEARYALICDLLILLTGSDYNLDWPVCTCGDGDKNERFQFYFHRFLSRENEPPTPHEFWINFPQVRETFGALFTQWRRRREEWGPGVYLYLGTQRSVSMYEEHRFIMLVWGLESLHRRRACPARGSQKLAQKITRILLQIAEGKDKKWLTRQLEHAGEPKLEQRLLENLEMLPIEVDKVALRRFCAYCANKRNEISHFGGRRHDRNYDNDVEELHKMSEALSNLYHLLLLREIGINDELIRVIATRGLRSFGIKASFVAVGLMPPNVLRDPASEAATAAALRKHADGERAAEDPIQGSSQDPAQTSDSNAGFRAMDPPDFL